MGKYRYTVVIEWDPEERLYVATLPVLSIGSYGETREEAMDMIKESAAVTIEGLKADRQAVPVGDEDTVGFVEVVVL